MFALMDCNNFYASCERVFRPDLVGKPIVVLSNNDGCVIARSNEAKAAGVPMGAPAYQHKELFEKNNINVFSANFALYGDMSRRVMEVVGDYAPEMEIYSIDEAFLKLAGLENHTDLRAYCSQMRQKVLQWTGIPISVGIAPTKSLSKAANKIAKKFQQRTGGVHYIETEELRVKALKWLPVEDVWGIGRQHSKRLKARNINTAYDFTLLDDAWIKKYMTVAGLRLKKDLKGIPVFDMEPEQPKQSIATTRTFESNYSDPAQIRERVVTFAVSCSEKLRSQKCCCNSLMVFLHTNWHRRDLPQYMRNIVIQLPYPTNSAIELAEFAVKAFEKIYRSGYQYKKAGVVVMDFTPEDLPQLALFDNSDPRHIPLMAAMDVLNKSFGRRMVKLASQDPKREWKMRQERLSPRYTTKLSEIITVNA